MPGVWQDSIEGRLDLFKTPNGHQRGEQRTHPDRLAGEVNPAAVPLVEDEPEVHGLLALMVLHHARRHARFADGELLARLGRADEARAALERALALTRSDPERRFLTRRLAEL